MCFYGLNISCSNYTQSIKQWKQTVKEEHVMCENVVLGEQQEESKNRMRALRIAKKVAWWDETVGIGRES